MLTKCLIKLNVMIELCVDNFEFLYQNLLVAFGLFHDLKIDHLRKPEIDVLQSICSGVCNRCKVRRSRAAFLHHFTSITALCCVCRKRARAYILNEKIYYITNAEMFGGN